MPRKITFGIVVFPGSNCDHDAYYACKNILHQDTELLWHKDADLKRADVIILPGGFSYGDYLRCGAIARFSPIMKEVIRFANEGGTVVGFCNGFQILVEAGLLPGVLLRNASLQFVCKYVYLKVEHAETRFTSACQPGEVLAIPIAHGEGNYFTDPETLAVLEKENRILFRYCNEQGMPTSESNPNGSMANIAGIVNEHGNVLGMMPHPERAVDPLLRHVDGRKVFQSIIESFTSRNTDHAMDVAGLSLSTAHGGRR
jgi:phosphoribosylformylglycinamidine synthase